MQTDSAASLYSANLLLKRPRLLCVCAYFIDDGRNRWVGFFKSAMVIAAGGGNFEYDRNGIAAPRTLKVRVPRGGTTLQAV